MFGACNEAVSCGDNCRIALRYRAIPGVTRIMAYVWTCSLKSRAAYGILVRLPCTGRECCCVPNPVRRSESWRGVSLVAAMQDGSSTYRAPEFGCVRYEFTADATGKFSGGE